MHLIPYDFMSYNFYFIQLSAFSYELILFILPWLTVLRQREFYAIVYINSTLQFFAIFHVIILDCFLLKGISFSSPSSYGAFLMLYTYVALFKFEWDYQPEEIILYVWFLILIIDELRPATILKISCFCANIIKGKSQIPIRARKFEFFLKNLHFLILQDYKYLLICNQNNPKYTYILILKIFFIKLYYFSFSEQYYGLQGQYIIRELV